MKADAMITQPARTHLAQLNVATALDDMTSARMSGFVSRLNKVNAVAERSPGFVWRLMDETGSATSLQYADDPRFIVNLSVWESPESLFDELTGNPAIRTGKALRLQSRRSIRLHHDFDGPGHAAPPT